jgi:cytochrome P450
LETGRLYPPVTRTFHTSAGDVYQGIRIPAGIEIVHYFPILQRRPAAEPDAGRFRPERWCQTASGASPYSNLFLRGQRTCPGRDLILFVCKSAIAIQVSRAAQKPGPSELSADPLPYSFPKRALRFRKQKFNE